MPKSWLATAAKCEMMKRETSVLICERLLLDSSQTALKACLLTCGLCNSGLRPLGLSSCFLEAINAVHEKMLPMTGKPGFCARVLVFPLQTCMAMSDLCWLMLCKAEAFGDI